MLTHTCSQSHTHTHAYTHTHTHTHTYKYLKKTHAHTHTYAHTHTHTHKYTDYKKTEFTRNLNRDSRQRKITVRDGNRTGLLFQEQKSLEVWSAGVQRGFLLEGKGKIIPSRRAEDRKVSNWILTSRQLHMVLFSALSRRVGPFQIPTIIIMTCSSLTSGKRVEPSKRKKKKSTGSPQEDQTLSRVSK